MNTDHTTPPEQDTAPYQTNIAGRQQEPCPAGESIAKTEIRSLPPAHQHAVNTIATALRELVLRHGHHAVLALFIVWEEIVTEEFPHNADVDLSEHGGDSK